MNITASHNGVLQYLQYLPLLAIPLKALRFLLAKTSIALSRLALLAPLLARDLQKIVS